MKVGEILRNLADAIDSASAKSAAEAKVFQAQQAGDEANSMAQQAADDAMAQVNDLAPEPEEVEVDNTDNTIKDTMIPPLQQEHELLKLAGNNADTFADTFADTDDGIDELEIIKKMAGIGEPQQDLNVAGQIGPVEINPRKNAALMYHTSGV